MEQVTTELFIGGESRPANGCPTYVILEPASATILLLKASGNFIKYTRSRVPQAHFPEDAERPSSYDQKEEHPLHHVRPAQVRLSELRRTSAPSHPEY